MTCLRRSFDSAQRYLEAARRVLTMKESCCCWAIQKSGGDTCAEFKDLFHPRADGSDASIPAAIFDYGWNWSVIEDYNRIARNERSLALCFMAAMVEAGDA